MVKTSIRRFEEALDSGDQETARARLLAAIRQIDKAADRGIVHKNNAARKKSRLTRLLNRSAAG
jgi:small subunit ribosomal protein S20